MTAFELELRREIEKNRRALQALEAVLDGRCPVQAARDGLVKRKRMPSLKLALVEEHNLVMLPKTAPVAKDSD